MTAYLLCATPRSGSTLLCGLLKATGVAGVPESYFRAQNEARWAEHLGVPVRQGSLDYREFAAAVSRAGRTSNGVFGARIMWGTLDRVAFGLGADSEDPAVQLSVLDRAFDRPRFVHLWRQDAVAQAVSWLRAEQTGFWHHGEPPRPGAAPHYDGPRLRAFVRMVNQHNAAWRAWFEAAGVNSYSLRYEDLVADMDDALRRLLEWLRITVPPGHRIVPLHQRQADEINTDWIARFHMDFPSDRSSS